MLAYFFMQAGALTGLPEDDWDLRSFFREQTGEGPFQVNLSAFQRWAWEPGSPELLKHQKGDLLYSYAWIAPFGISVGMAVNTADFIQKEREKRDVSTLISALPAGLAGGYGAMEEMAVFRTFAELFGNKWKSPTDAVLQSMERLPSQFVFSWMRHIRNLTDNNMRETWSRHAYPTMSAEGIVLGRALNQVVNKIPFLSETLPLTYESMGIDVPRERYQEGTHTFLNVFVNPGFVSYYTLDPMISMLLTPYEETKEKAQIPSRIGRNLDISKTQLNAHYLTKSNGERYFEKGVQVELTGPDKAEMQRLLAKNVTLQLRPLKMTTEFVTQYRGGGMSYTRVDELPEKEEITADVTAFKDLPPEDQAHLMAGELRIALAETKQWFIENKMDSYLEEGYGQKAQIDAPVDRLVAVAYTEQSKAWAYEWAAGSAESEKKPALAKAYKKLQEQHQRQAIALTKVARRTGWIVNEREDLTEDGPTGTPVKTLSSKAIKTEKARTKAMYKILRDQGSIIVEY